MRDYSAQIRSVRRNELTQRQRRKQRKNHHVSEFVVEPLFPNIQRLWASIRNFFLPRRPLKPYRYDKEVLCVVCVSMF